MIIAIDIDDTLTNTKEKQRILWKKYVQENPTNEFTEELPKNINSFENKYICDFWDKNRETLSFKTTFKNNADLITNKLHEEGYIIKILTSRPDCKYKNLKPRLKKWLKNNNIYEDEIITNVMHKGIYCKNNKIDILIDDSIEHIKEAIDNKVKGILFNENENYECLQTNNWIDLYKIIKELDK